MLVLRLSSPLEKQELLERAQKNGIILLNTRQVKSLEEIRLAEYLTKESFKEKTNIAKKFELEFLLWITGTRDINKALEIASFDDPSDFLAISFSGLSRKQILDITEARERKLALDKNADPLSLEKISLSRI